MKWAAHRTGHSHFRQSTRWHHGQRVTRRADTRLPQPWQGGPLAALTGSP
jgi:hypothetical protein